MNKKILVAVGLLVLITVLGSGCAHTPTPAAAAGPVVTPAPVETHLVTPIPPLVMPTPQEVVSPAPFVIPTPYVAPYTPPPSKLTPPPVVPVVRTPLVPPPAQATGQAPALKDPTAKQMVSFLLADNTDTLTYVYPTFVCENFAETLQRNAHAAGWLCALVVVQLSGYPDPGHLGISSNTSHALNAFQTTDMGIVYVDDTGAMAYEQHPLNMDTTVKIQVGSQYVPAFLYLRQTGMPPVAAWVQ